MAAATPWPLALSDRAKTLPGSPIRALLSSARHDGWLDLGGGIPDPNCFPHRALGAVAARVIDQPAPTALQYAPTEGLLPLRSFVAERLARRGCQTTPEQIIITHGSQQALATVAALLTSPTQAVALEQPVYPGAMQAFALAQAPAVALPVTPQGWHLEALRHCQVAALYVIPSHHNPTGRKAEPEQCQRLARYAETTGCYVIEDDAYGELDFSGNAPRPVLADAPNRGILLGSFSKTLCPGLRVGWVAAPLRLIEPMVRVLQASSLQPGTLAQHLAWGLVESLDWDAHLTELRHIYAERAARLRAECTALGLTSEPPKGGFFLWVRSAGAAAPFAQAAAARGCSMIPESAFHHPRHPGPDLHLRLAFTRFTGAPNECAQLRAALGGHTVL